MSEAEDKLVDMLRRHAAEERDIIWKMALDDYDAARAVERSEHENGSEHGHCVVCEIRNIRAVRKLCPAPWTYQDVIDAVAKIAAELDRLLADRAAKAKP